MKARKTWDNIIENIKCELEYTTQVLVNVWEFKGKVGNFIEYAKSNGLVFTEKTGDNLVFEKDIEEDKNIEED